MAEVRIVALEGDETGHDRAKALETAGLDE
jgi:hypothetical protein